VEEYGLIGLESLHVKDMMVNGHLAKHIGDAAWSEFCRQLTYKGEWYGCQIEQIDPWYPSSKRCSACGAVMEVIPLRVRQWECPECQVQHDRDVNAARNILRQATVGTTGRHAGGVDVRPVCQQQAGTLKPEAHHLSGG
jgi:putative transposase